LTTEIEWCRLPVSEYRSSFVHFVFIIYICLFVFYLFLRVLSAIKWRTVNSIGVLLYLKWVHKKCNSRTVEVAVCQKNLC